MRRILSLVLAGCVLAFVLLDPYTRYHDAGDLVIPGPGWQRLLGVLDLSLLACVLVLLWMRRPRQAFQFLMAETLLALLAVSILIGRDGFGRFRAGFGGTDYLPVYLLAMAFRLAVLLLTVRAREPRHLAPTM